MKKIALVILLLQGVRCSTNYQIYNQSLLEQFAASTTDKKVLITPPYDSYPGTGYGYDLRLIKCLDKNGTEQVVNLTNKTRIKFTTKDSVKTTFYLYTLVLKDNIVTGGATNSSPAKTIKIREIIKIEIMK